MTTYSPPVATYTPLQTITLGSSASSVTFLNIPNTYRDLVIVGNLATSANSANTKMTFNGSATGYNQVYMAGNGSSTASTSTSNTTSAYIDFYSYPRTIFDYMFTLQVLDYSATDKHKSFLIRSGNASTSYLEAIAGRWANTAAISSIEFTIGSQTFSVGSTFSLYGIAA